MTMTPAAVNQASLLGLTAKEPTEIRNRDIAQGGVSATDHFGFIAFGPECLVYTGNTRTEKCAFNSCDNRAPQGCDLSADSRAGMARGGCDVASALKHTDSDMFEVNLLKAKFGLDKGVHFISLSGGNTVQLTRTGYSDVWFYDGDGYNFWDQSHFQINASLNGRAAPGVWNLYVRNNYSGTPSAAYQVTINP